MNVRVICSKTIPFFLVKHRSRRYFKNTEYIARNNVYSHISADSTYHLKKRIIDITIEKADTNTLDFVFRYLKYVFRNANIGLTSSDASCFDYFDGLNYTKI